MGESNHSLHVAHALHHVGLVVEFLRHPVKSRHVPATPAEEQVPAVAGVVDAVGAELGKCEVEVLKGMKL